ncbi:NAD(P)-dependent oxidoreductase [Sphingomonas sp. BIUV-7]|uniref:NAD(P)-dependent oxidoreductase n=1 Tax=Sphingomonas natans TaxID=3063330 RepID=A0ABT8Y889_9SPHN|nr:NAD(P)-dependent oxidoreductase [Sphingomonas sp. BIUV-7]MDO6414530.1 NAD(P)-dependent oxidoreductase [Sphingomonas sp. BIUV-7]
MPRKRRIGWIGLGSIGTQMVKRLIAAGEEVMVYPRGVGLTDVRTAGAGQCPDYPALASQSDILGLCVYDDEQVCDILLRQGALAALAPGSTLIIHTTGSPDVMRNIAQRAPAGVDVLDACFSGGPADVAAATLTLMVGGEEAALDRVRVLLGHYAGRIVRVGPTGDGQKLKLINNLLFATNLMNAAQAVALAERQGFTPHLIAELMETCSGASYALKLLAHPAPSAIVMQAIRPYLEKDVALAMSNADRAGLDVAPFAATAAYFARPEVAE